MEESDENTAFDQPAVDEAMLEMGDFVAQMSDIEGLLVSEEEAMVMQAEKVSLDIPIQLDLRVQEDGTVVIGTSPPLYYVETTIMPVFHQMQLNIEIDRSKQ